MLTKELENTLNKAISIAHKYKHEYATLEHLLLSLLEDPEVQSLCKEQNIKIDLLSNELISYLKNDLIILITPEDNEPKPSNIFQKAIQRAAIHNRSLTNKKLCGLNVLTEFFIAPEAKATQLLSKYGITRQDIIKELAIREQGGDYNKDRSLPVIKQNKIIQNSEDLENKTTQSKIINKTDTSSCLSAYCTNINERAAAKKIDSLIGREKEIERTAEVLCRRQKNNPLLIGEPGVGKTAIAEGLAHKILEEQVPDILKGCEIYSLDIGALVAGTRYRGDFEERIKNLLTEIKERKNIILFIDEIHTIIGAGTTNTASLDASNLIKPALARGEIRCIGSTTFKEFHQHFGKDAALMRRFQKIVIEEPDEETAINILKGLQSYYESYHKVTYTPEAIEAAVNLSVRYIHDRHLPDKAIDLIDEAGARKKLSKNDDHITVTDIEEVLAKILQVPSMAIAENDLNKLKKLESNLNSVIYGQDQAIEDLCASIKMDKAGLRSDFKPTGCFLFAGPTGTGKTELAKQVAHFCSMEFYRFDMSEYAESHSVARLLGAPPGYSGYDQGGLLTEAISKTPYAVILFDEIEKAHKDIYNILLQIMDYGKLTDSTGKIANFTHSIIILTANAGAREYQKNRIGFGDLEADRDNQAMGAIEELFTPEFLGRLDNVILFNDLNDKTIKLIIEKSLRELGAQLADRKVLIEITKSVKDYLAEKCFGANKSGGARLLQKTIDTQIKQVIAEEILFGTLQRGGKVQVDYKNDQLYFSYNETVDNNASEAELV